MLVYVYLPPHCSEQVLVCEHLIIEPPSDLTHRRVCVVLPQRVEQLDHALREGIQ